jgi:hypothetical protein
MLHEIKPRAPAARAKLAGAEAVLAELEQHTAILALEMSEGKTGSEKAMASHRSKIEAAKKQVNDLRKATELAERLDREADAVAAAAMRASQLTVFEKAMAGRLQAMTSALEALTAFAIAYSAYSQATLTAMESIPAGTIAPQVAMGPLGAYGASWSNCSRMLEAELYRVAPERADGVGRLVAPLAKAPLHSDTNYKVLPKAIDEFRKADATVLAEIARQVSDLDKRAMTAAQKAAA